MVYKLTLVSTHGTGKTTLASGIEHCLKQRGVEARHIREMATSAMERGLPINEEATPESQLFILHSQFRTELKYSGPRKLPPHYEVLACDRSYENFCYFENILGPEDHDLREHVLQIVLGHIKNFPYDRSWLVPIVDSHIDVGNDVRSTDREFQLTMDKKIRAFLHEHSIDYIELPSQLKEGGYRQEWTKIIVNQTLKDLGKPERLYMR